MTNFRGFIDTKHDAGKRTLRAYVTGFVLSIALTLGSYALVNTHVRLRHEAISHMVIIAVIMVFAIAQLAVQLLFFLHLGDEAKPRWKLLSFLFALLVVVIVVVGSLWIMSNLNYHMSPQQMQQYMYDQASSGL